MKKIFASEILTDNRLNDVAGGTSAEYIDMAKLLPRVTVVRYGGKSVHQEFMNKEQVQDWLKTNLNIDAKISLGNRFFNRPGDPNIYGRNGENLTHNEVLSEIKNFLDK